MGSISPYPPAPSSFTPSQTLAYAQLTTGQSGIGTGVTDVAGLAITITVPEGRRIRLSAFAIVQKKTSTNFVWLRIHEGTTARASSLMNVITDEYETLMPTVILTPTAGTHTYKVVSYCGANTVDLLGNADYPAYLLAEDITGQAASVAPASVPVGVIAQGYVTASVNGLPAADTVLVSVNVVVPAGRTLKITAGANVTNNSAGGRSLGAIRVDGVAVGRWCDRTTAAAGYYLSASDSVLVSPSAGAHTIDMTMNSISGSASIEAATSEPIHLIVEDVTPTPAPSSGAPGSTLGYAEITSSSTSATAASTVDIPGLETIVTVPAGRRLRITVKLIGYSNTVPSRVAATIKEGAVVLGNFESMATVAGNGVGLLATAVVSPSAGAHTYRAAITATLQTGFVYADANLPCFILVEDITGAVWPQGSAVTAGMVASEPWTPFTPTWTSTGTAPAIGNGTLSGRYTRIGRTVIGTIYHIMGSTTTYGTGNWLWGLPVPAYTGTSGWVVTGALKAYQGGNSLNALIRLWNSTSTLNAVYSATWPAGTETHVTNIAPWTWVSGASIDINFIYEAAA